MRKRIKTLWALLAAQSCKAMVTTMLCTLALLLLPAGISEALDFFAGAVRVSAIMTQPVSGETVFVVRYTDAQETRTVSMATQGEGRYTARVPKMASKVAVCILFADGQPDLVVTDKVSIKHPFQTDMLLPTAADSFDLSPPEATFFYQGKISAYSEVSLEPVIAFRHFQVDATRAQSQPVRPRSLAGFAALAVLVAAFIIPSKDYRAAWARLRPRRFSLDETQKHGLFMATYALLAFAAFSFIASFIPIFCVWWAQAQVYLLTLVLTLYSSAVISALYRPKPGRKLVKTKSMALFLTPMLLPVLLLGLRYSVGFDYLYTYVPGYRAAAMGWPHMEDPLFGLLNVALAKMGLGSESLFAVCAFITVFAFGAAIAKSAALPLVGLFVYLLGGQYFIAYNYVNQCLAIALLMLGYAYLFEGKWYVFTALTLVAGFLHSAVWLGFILLPLYYVRLHPYLLTAVAGVALALQGLLRQGVLALLTNFGGWYAQYVNSSETFAYTQNYALLFIVSLLPTLVYGLLLAKRAGKNKKYRLLYAGVLLAVMLHLILEPIVSNTYRIAYIFSATAVFFIPEILSLIQTRKYRIGAAAAMLLPIIAYAFYLEFAENYGMIIPYHSVFG